MNTVKIDSKAATAGSPAVGRLQRFGARVADRPKMVLVLFFIAVIAMGGLGSGLFPRLVNGGYDVPNSESDRTAQALRADFGAREPLVVLALELQSGVDSVAGTAKANEFLTELQQVSGVGEVTSYWSPGKPVALRGRDDNSGQVIIYGLDDAVKARADTGLAIEERAAQLDQQSEEFKVYVGGSEPINRAVGDQITSDLKIAEAIAIPLQFIMLLFVFGSLWSAGLPFIVALGSVIGSFFMVWLVSLTTDVSIFALNLITGLGLGLGIDYALLIVTRFREELHGSGDNPGLEPRAAVARTMATAGRTVLFSGLTVMVVLAAMLIFPQFFLKSFGYAGIAATGLAMVSALTALPAILAVAGRRLDSVRILRRELVPAEEGAWSKVARMVMRRPLPIALGVTALLAIMAAPVLGVTFAEIDQRALPADNPVARSSALMADRFDGRSGTPVNIIVPDAADDSAAVADYANGLSQLKHVVRVTTPTEIVVKGKKVAANPQAKEFTTGNDARLAVIADVNPRSVDGSELVTRIRAVETAAGKPIVGGVAAEFTDSQNGIADAGKWALLWIAVSTLVLLFLFTGSILLPIKAVLLNVLSLLATLGVLVWVFQEGNAQWLVGDFTVTNSVDTSMAVLVAVVAFALSMDYEVFLISRIVEEHRNGLDTNEAVVRGLQRSGRIITAAALLLAVVFASFVSSGVTSIKQLGLGIAFAILLDATVVRGLLVPALMRIAGQWNWWAPRPLARLHSAIGLAD